MSDDSRFKALRDEADAAESRLLVAVVDTCPGDHLPIQHRDRKPPWCHSCGRTSRGVLVAPEDAR